MERQALGCRDGSEKCKAPEEQENKVRLGKPEFLRPSDPAQRVYLIHDGKFPPDPVVWQPKALSPHTVFWLRLKHFLRIPFLLSFREFLLLPLPPPVPSFLSTLGTELRHFRWAPRWASLFFTFFLDGIFWDSSCWGGHRSSLGKEPEQQIRSEPLTRSPQSQAASVGHFLFLRRKRARKGGRRTSQWGDCGQGVALSVCQLNLYRGTQYYMIRVEPSGESFGIYSLEVS